MSRIPSHCVLVCSSHFSRIQLFVTLWTVACQLLFMGFSSQEYWTELPCSAPGNLPDPGTEPASPALVGQFFTTAATWESNWLISYTTIQNKKFKFEKKISNQLKNINEDGCLNLPEQIVIEVFCIFLMLNFKGRSQFRLATCLGALNGPWLSAGQRWSKCWMEARTQRGQVLCSPEHRPACAVLVLAKWSGNQDPIHGHIQSPCCVQIIS